MKDNWKHAHMDVAKRYAQESKAERKKVGAILVKDDKVISIGINGTAAGQDNCCEEKAYMDSDAGAWLDSKDIEERWPYKDEKGRYKLITIPEVLHAESNLISKLAKSSESAEDGVMFVTLSPCLECSKLIKQAGIKEIYFDELYRDTSGINYLKKVGVKIEQLKE